MDILAQFCFRMAGGLAFSLAVTSPRDVAINFFRVHAYVLLGLHALAALVVAQTHWVPIWMPLGAAVLSYSAAACCIYSKATHARVGLWGVVLLSLLACEWGFAKEIGEEGAPHKAAKALWLLDPVLGGLLLGSVCGAMLLGHYYLNVPGMKLAPLQRLLLIVAAAVAFRALLAAAGIAAQCTADSDILRAYWPFVALRWLSALVGTAIVTWMSWQTLKIPNTQSATGILYVGVIVAITGELVAQLVNQHTHAPL